MIKIDHVFKTYKTRHRRTNALKDINITFPDKGLVVILGESGAGKSTLLKTISLQEKPSIGSVYIDGNDVTDISGREKSMYTNQYFAMLFQDLNLMKEFTVYNNLRLARQIQGKDLTREEAVDFMQKFNLSSDILDELPGNLSGGQQQRVAIVRAFIKDFKVMLADEPTGALDPDNADEVLKSLKSIAETRLVIAVTHDRELAEKYADRIIHIKNGEVASDSFPLKEEPAIRRFSFHKMHLPFSSVIKLAFHGVRKSIVRFILTMLTTLISVGLTMATLDFIFYDEYKGQEKILNKENISYVMLNIYATDKISNYKEQLSTRDLSFIKSSIGNKYISGISPNIVSTLNIRLLDENIDRDYHNDTANNRPATFYYTPDDDFISDFKFTMTGRMPSEEEGKWEVVLTPYDCVQLGWIEKDECDEEHYQEIINAKKLEFSFIDSENGEITTDEMPVVGILDTGFVIEELPKNSDPYTYFDNASEQIPHNRRQFELYHGVFLSRKNYQKIRIFNQNTGYYSQIRDTRLEYYVPLIASPLKVAKFYNDQKFTVQHESGGKIQQFNLVINCDTRFRESIYYVNNFHDTIGDTAWWFVGIFGLLGLLSFISFIKASVERLSPSIKVLQSLGISSKASMIIYITESLILSLIAFIIAACPYELLIYYVGNYIARTLALPVNPFQFSWSVYFLCGLGLCLIGSLFAFVLALFLTHERNKKDI